jgi:O-methyltransferase
MKVLKKLLKKYLGLETGHLDRSGRVERYSVMMHVFEFAAKSDIDGCFMEFGTFRGESLTKAYHAYKYWLGKAQQNGWRMREQNMYAFDSFEGLPNLSASDQQRGYAVFSGGQYACSKQEVIKNLTKENVDISAIKMVKGFFDQSLTDELKESISDKAIVIHIDVDLYSSCVSVLDFIRNFIQDGTVVIFDDYYCFRANKNFGVRKAYEEWLAKNPDIQSQTYLNYGWSGKIFILST